MKRIQALIASAIMTGLVALAMLLIGINALLSPSRVPAANSRPAVASVAADSSQVAQLQNEVAQYQAQLEQANAQLQQYQQLFDALQARGVLRGTGGNAFGEGRGGNDD